MSLKEKLQNNVFGVINGFAARIARLEQLLMQQEIRFERDLAIQRQHLVRIKNGETLSDQFLLQGHAYRDLDPQAAWDMFRSGDADFILLDVSARGFSVERPAETLHIPLEELESRLADFPSKSVSIIVISEEGLRSVLACDFLVSRGFYNCNNVSGGWRHWRGHALKPVSGISA
jgi:rhodanese-related sulfurtransferase